MLIQELIYSILALKVGAFVQYFPVLPLQSSDVEWIDLQPSAETFLGILHTSQQPISPVSTVRQFYLYFLIEVAQNYLLKIQPTECIHFQSLM